MHYAACNTRCNGKNRIGSHENGLAGGRHDFQGIPFFPVNQCEDVVVKLVQNEGNAFMRCQLSLNPGLPGCQWREMRNRFETELSDIVLAPLLHSTVSPSLSCLSTQKAERCETADTMEMTTKEEALARRRAQNREAQRRFRWKQSQQKGKVLAAESRSEQQRAAEVDAQPSFEMPLENLALPTPDKEYGTDGCFITSGLRLFGNYTLLDSFNMQGCAARDEVLQITNDKDVDMPAMLTPPELELLSAGATTTPPDSEIEAPHQTTEAHNWPPFGQAESTNSIIQPMAYVGSNIEPQMSQSRGRDDDDTRDHTRTKSSTVLETNRAKQTPPEEDATEPPSNKAQGWMSSLHIAAQNGNDRIVRILLRHQSDTNERDSDDLTPLYYATVGGHEQVVTSLLERGAQVSSTDNQGRTMLHLAVIHRRDSVLKALLRHCADSPSPIDEYDDTGRTPLHVAVDVDFEAGVSLLLEHGANLNSKARKCPREARKKQ